MVEAIQCPSCQTRYGLKAERVRPGHRRAQCFRCGDAFHIEAEVARLLGLEQEAAPTATAQMRLLVPHHAPKKPPTSEEIAEHMGSLTLSDLTDEELSGETPALAPQAPAAPVAEAPAPPPAPVLEMPALEAPGPLATAPMAPMAELPELELPEAAPHGDGGFSSAKDAISKLFGTAPLAIPSQPSRQTPVDVESGLAALEDTLGGVKPEDLSPKPFALPPPPPPAPAPAPVPALELPTEFELPPLPAPPAPAPAAALETQEMQVETSGGFTSAKDAMSKIFGDLPPMPSPVPSLGKAETPSDLSLNLEIPGAAATKRLSLAEMHAAMAAEAPQPAPSPLPPPKPGAPAPVSATGRTTTGSFKLPVAPLELSPEEVTMVMPPPPGAAAAAPMASAPASDDPNLLKLKAGDQVFTGLSLETLSKWVEEGRILEDHHVARQFSENWIEASKVPGLRPVFERMKRSRQAPVDLSAPPSMPEPAKKSLFGGLFGKKE
ncbi:MAG TPA: zinc-ribbon domain-containing protein [Holophagaceae bacterium]|nr:zinc-ribbon domain-containing protein [Holophagaceae bacterium]